MFMLYIHKCERKTIIVPFAFSFSPCETTCFTSKHRFISCYSEEFHVLIFSKILHKVVIV